MKTNYREWLDGIFPKPHVALSRFSNAKRVEKYYGDLDRHYAKDRLNRVLQELDYSPDDYKRGVANPTLIPLAKGSNIYNGLKTLKSATKLYLRFCDETSRTETDTSKLAVATPKVRESEVAELRESLRLTGEALNETCRRLDSWRSKAENAELRLTDYQSRSWWRRIMG